MQLITFMRAREERDPRAFQHWYLEQMAPRLRNECAGIERLIVNVAQEGPRELRRATDSNDPRWRYDVVTQVWVNSVAGTKDLRNAEGKAEISQWIDQQHGYHVTEKVVLDKSTTASRGSNGIKVMRGMFFFEDMPDSAAKRSWTLHADLALKVHIGMSRYVQYWVEERLSTDDPPIRGISELFFATRDDLVARYYESTRGREEVTHDAGHFIREQLPRVYATEHVIKP